MIKLLRSIFFMHMIVAAGILQIFSAVSLAQLPAATSHINASNLTENYLASLGRPALKVFTDLDGLPQNSIMCLTFDSRGYLWVGTQDGAAYYSGHKWNLVNMPNRKVSNYIRTILNGSDGSLWFGTLGGGLVRLKEGRWTVYEKRPDELPDDKVRSLLETRGADGKPILWVGTYEKGLARFAGGRWTIYDQKNSGLPDNSIQTLYETIADDGGKTLWIGTYNGGLVSFKDDRWQVYNTTNSELPDNSVQAILETVAGNGARSLWVGMYNGGLASLKDGKWRSYANYSGFLKRSVTSLIKTTAPDGRQTVWVGIFGGGLARVEDEQLDFYDKKSSGLPDNGVLCLLTNSASSNSLTFWIGTISSGLIRMQSNKWRKLDNGDFESGVTALSEIRQPDNRRALLVGTNSSGLEYYQDGSWRAYNTDNSRIPHNHVRAILQTKDQRAIWLCTSGGLARIEGSNWTVYNTANSPLVTNNVITLLETTSDNGESIIWVGTVNKGLVRIEGDNWTRFDTDNSGLPNSTVLCLLKTANPLGGETIWIGTGGSGLVRYENGNWTTYQSGNSGLPNNRVTSLYATTLADGRIGLWVGTSGGLSRFQPYTEKSDWLTLTDSTQPALPNNGINSIQEDNQRRLFAFTAKGIARITAKTALPTMATDFTIDTFTIEDGLPSNGVNAGIFTADKRAAWAGTSAGLATLNLAESDEDHSGKPLFIERLLINNQRYPAEDLQGPGNIIKPLTLAYDENNILVEYNLLSYFKESETRYRTQLINFDKAPSEWLADYKKEYTNLGEGSYILRVWGRDYAGNISGPAEIYLRIKPAPWRSWPAYLCYLIVLGATGYGIVRLRLMVLHRRNEELELMVRERTAEVVRQKDKLTEQRDEIEASNQQILDSIHYAQCIQQAILPEQQQLGNVFRDYFILFKPKDIVSGDFYWFREKNGITIVAIADCTGHGVPGAFMSMIGTSLLNQLVIEKAITDPARILAELHEGIRQALKQQDGREESQDGMDIGLCRIDQQRQLLTFAGAKRPLYYLNRSGELIEIKGDRRSVGGKQKELKRTFNNHQVSIKDVDKIYLTTDGFGDQNGPERLKYGNRRLKKFLQEHSRENMLTQHLSLLQDLADYQADEPQRDDITIIGIKLEQKI